VQQYYITFTTENQNQIFPQKFLFIFRSPTRFGQIYETS